MRIAIPLFLALTFASRLPAQPSIAREWGEALLQTMQEDLARPQVQARNLYHFSMAVYDAWAAYDGEASTYLLGKDVDGFACPCRLPAKPADVEAARREAVSFAAFRFLSARYSRSPQNASAVQRFRDLMQKHGYDFREHSIDYASGSPAALGNYIAQCVLGLGRQDGADEETNYVTQDFRPINPPLSVTSPAFPPNTNPNHWQALRLKRAIDYDGYPVFECRCGGKPFITLIDSIGPDGRRITDTQTFQGVSWGKVKPFALRKFDQRTYVRDRRAYQLYHDPGSDFLPRLDTAKGGGNSGDYQWGHALVATWSALLDPNDGVQWDISPGSMGNVQQYPKNLIELRSFFNLETGKDPGTGREINPRTGQPYAPQQVPRGDFVRAAVQYWAEGPYGETPPGHWLSLLNYVSDRPGLAKKFNGKGPVMGALEWDVKAYFLLGAALHDAAVAAWGVNAWYESARPITAIRYMASLGQSTDPKLPSYHPAGIPLLPKHIELVKKGDPLAGKKGEHVGKIKVYAWKGPFEVETPLEQTAGVGWILAENWYPYQPQIFVTPPYGGFVSGHAALSHAAAEALTLLTGDAYFPGGMGQHTVSANSDFLKIEKGPSMDITLQWATYRDAADQASISRIWGGTNTPFDDIPGRLIGAEAGTLAFHAIKGIFYKDRDRDGYLSYMDCDDNNPKVNPGAGERCDGLDNDCNGKIDDVEPPCGGG
jgi:hypothetical protein